MTMTVSKKASTGLPERSDVSERAPEIELRRLFHHPVLDLHIRGIERSSRILLQEALLDRAREILRQNIACPLERCDQRLVILRCPAGRRAPSPFPCAMSGSSNPTDSAASTTSERNPSDASMPASRWRKKSSVSDPTFSRVLIFEAVLPCMPRQSNPTSDSRRPRSISMFRMATDCRRRP